MLDIEKVNDRMAENLGSASYDSTTMLIMDFAGEGESPVEFYNRILGKANQTAKEVTWQLCSTCSSKVTSYFDKATAILKDPLHLQGRMEYLSEEDRLDILAQQEIAVAIAAREKVERDGDLEKEVGKAATAIADILFQGQGAPGSTISIHNVSDNSYIRTEMRPYMHRSELPHYQYPLPHAWRLIGNVPNVGNVGLILQPKTDTSFATKVTKKNCEYGMLDPLLTDGYQMELGILGATDTLSPEGTELRRLTQRALTVAYGGKVNFIPDDKLGNGVENRNARSSKLERYLKDKVELLDKPVGRKNGKLIYASFEIRYTAEKDHHDNELSIERSDENQKIRAQKGYAIERIEELGKKLLSHRRYSLDKMIPESYGKTVTMLKEFNGKTIIPEEGAFSSEFETQEAAHHVAYDGEINSTDLMVRKGIFLTNDDDVEEPILLVSVPDDRATQRLKNKLPIQVFSKDLALVGA